jgi:acetyl-CoA carboxylase biotin carboxyl carrier protein
MTDEPALDGGSTEAAELPGGFEAPGAAADDPADPPGEAATATLDPGDASLLALIDRLGSLLDRSDLSELAVESGGTRLVLRKPAAIAPAAGVGAVPGAGGDGAASPAGGPAPVAAPGGSAAAPEAPGRPSVKAPLTGVWYSSPAPGSAPFVAAGREVAVGQVIGLIEAMKLFNEIKSDLAGRVVRVIPESGALVKAKQPLIEVEPL